MAWPIVETAERIMDWGHTLVMSVNSLIIPPYQQHRWPNAPTGSG